MEKVSRKERGKMLLKQFAIILCLLAAQAQSQNRSTNAEMSHEETVVRSAYAKLAYATQIEIVREAVDDWDLRPGSVDWTAFSNRMKNGEITFQLNNIRVGDFSDIANVQYADLVTKPNGQDILSVAHTRWTFSTDEPTSVAVDTAQPVWTKAQILTEDWNIPFAEAFKIMQAGGAEDFTGYHRYAALDVTVTFQGHATSYHALFFFGNSAKTGEKILVGDMVTGASALNIFLHSSVYPATLLETNIRNIPFVSQWLKSNIMPTATGGIRQVTCDLYALHCGLAAEDVQRALGSKPTAKLPAHPTELGAHLVEASFHPRLEGTLLMQSDPVRSSISAVAQPLEVRHWINSNTHCCCFRWYMCRMSSGCNS